MKILSRHWATLGSKATPFRSLLCIPVLSPSSNQSQMWVLSIYILYPDQESAVFLAFSLTSLEVVPPFSILTKLSMMLSEFLAFFAQMASAAITEAVGETTSLVQAPGVCFHTHGRVGMIWNDVLLVMLDFFP